MSLRSLTVLVPFLTSAFGLPSTSSELVTRQSSTNPNAAPPGWSFVGCYTDNNAASRTLQQAVPLVNPNMTQAACISYCSHNFPPSIFAGMEFSDECYCDLDIQGTATKVNDSQCNFPCGGDNTLTCGAANLVSIFQNINSVFPIPQNIPKLGDWTFDGCFTDAVGSNPRTLAERFQVAGGVTIEGCTAECTKSGFSIAGLEFGLECWCGNSFSLPIADITAPLSDCSKACQAEPTELCGAANRLAVYLSASASTPTATPAAPTTTTVKQTTTAPTTSAPPTTTVNPTKTQ